MNQHQEEQTALKSIRRANPHEEDTKNAVGGNSREKLDAERNPEKYNINPFSNTKRVFTNLENSVLETLIVWLHFLVRPM